MQGDGVITYGEFCKGLCLPVDGDADKVLVGKRHTGMTEEVRLLLLISVKLDCEALSSKLRTRIIRFL